MTETIFESAVIFAKYVHVAHTVSFKHSNRKEGEGIIYSFKRDGMESYCTFHKDLDILNKLRIEHTEVL